MRALAAAAFDWLAFLAMVAAIVALWIALDAPPACAAVWQEFGVEISPHRIEILQNSA